MPELSAGTGARLSERASPGGGVETQTKGAKLVSGCEPAVFLLGPGTRLSSHCSHLDELCLARSLAPGPGGDIGKTLAPASGKLSRPQAWPGENGPWHRLPVGTPIVATERRDRSCR